MRILAHLGLPAGWTVSGGTTNEVAWAKSLTGDGHTASDGTFFVDLTGFGADSPNGALEQSVQNLVVGQLYSFSLDIEVVGAVPVVTIGGIALSLTAGSSFTVGNDVWTRETGVFTAAATNPLLRIQNPQSGQQITFVDNVVVNGSVPEPPSLLLFGIALAHLCKFRLRSASK